MAAEYDPRRMRRAMQHPDAVDYACSLWGLETGYAEVRHEEAPSRRYMVGTKGAEPGKRALGRGRTWEEAFEDAVKRGLS